MTVITTMKGKNKTEEAKRNCKRPFQIGGSKMPLDPGNIRA